MKQTVHDIRVISSLTWLGWWCSAGHLDGTNWTTNSSHDVPQTNNNIHLAHTYISPQFNH